MKKTILLHEFKVVRQWNSTSCVCKSISIKVFSFPSPCDNTVHPTHFKKLFFHVTWYGCSSPQKARMFLLYVTHFVFHTFKHFSTLLIDSVIFPATQLVWREEEGKRNFEELGCRWRCLGLNYSYSGPNPVWDCSTTVKAAQIMVVACWLKSWLFGVIKMSWVKKDNKMLLYCCFSSVLVSEHVLPFVFT